MQSLTRRSFLKQTVVLTAAAAGSAPFLAGCGTTQGARRAGRVIGPNEEIRVAVVGFHSQGASHISSIQGLRAKGEKVRIVALCDVDRRVLDSGVKALADKGDTVAAYTDIRQLLENRDVDALSIATPNHWHALGSIWAVQAGKDVSVEKPVSHNVWEGRQAVRAARKYSRIVQTGTQSRSSHGIAEAVAWVQAGNLGPIRIARGLCYKRRASIGKTAGPQAVPDSIDYDLWCGPAPLDPPRRNSKGNGPVHYEWHWFWAYGAGDLGNQGIHQMDIARWFLGERALSPRILSVGGRLGYVDDAETPNTQIVFHDYPKAPLIFEVRGLPSQTGSNQMDKFLGAGIGVVVHCEGGHVVVPDYNSATAFDRQGKEIRKFQGSTSHHGNFFTAMRSRRVADLHADILEGHLSSALCHTANISYRLGQTAAPDEIREIVRTEPDGADTFGRMVDHLRANDVDLNVTRATLGVPLRMDPRTERFIGNAAADTFLSRPYRPPFVVPQRV
jgi:predicted dehydrogenase